MNDTELNLQTILRACENKKAYSFDIIDISRIAVFTDYFIICSVNNERQGEAVSEEILTKMSERGIEVNHKEGYETKRWILLDFGFAVVHIFHKDERRVYNLENLWSDGINIKSEKFGIENWN